jgi:hypothetical protein
MSSIVQEEAKIHAAPAVSQKDYLKKVFVKNRTEFKVDYKNVGKNRYRINFWVHEARPGALTHFKSSRIGRSYYVVLKRNGTSWTHTINKD